MQPRKRTKITVSTVINAGIDRIWDLWTKPHHIIHWNHASDDWLTSYAENDPRDGGRFLSHMEARDGSAGFDFTGGYNKIIPKQSIVITLDDSRSVNVDFVEREGKTFITETFEAEEINSIELQKIGWQSILDSFKNYAETSEGHETLNFEVKINSPVDKVYENMLREEKYREWTSVFNPTSHYEGSWAKGSKIVFLGTDSDGNQGGMISRIRENIPCRFISIEHLGIIKNGKEILAGEEVDRWKGALENYSFIKEKDCTVVSVEIDSNKEFESYFKDTWPKALEKLKSICEKHLLNVRDT